MGLFPSRAEHLSTHLRERILAQEWTEPFPNILEWSRQLGIGKNTLSTALHVLKKQGFLEIERRQGVRLKRKPKVLVSAPTNRLVRIICYGVDLTGESTFIQWARHLSVVLQKKGGQLRIERHSDEHLREICGGSLKDPLQGKDLLLPLSLPAKYQRMLPASGQPFICVGTPIKEPNLSYIGADLPAAIRHATHTLIRRGFHKLTFILSESHSPGTDEMEETFMKTCREWTRQPIQGRVLRVGLRDQEERQTLKRLAERLSIPHGLLIMSHIPLGLIATTLMRRNIQLPTQADLIVVASPPDTVRIDPPITHYSIPMDLFVKTLSNAIFDFWETGKPPVLKKLLPLTMVSPQKN